MKVLYRTTTKQYEPAFSQGRLVHPSKVTFPFLVGGVPGKYTCKAKCDYCFIPFHSKGKEPHQWSNIEGKIRLEKTQIDDLKSQGFNVVAMIPDSFAWNGKYLESGILYHNRLYDQDELSHMGVAWTSGVPLLKGDAGRLLHLAWKNNIRLVAATSHGITDGEIPIKGVAQPSVVREFVGLMHDYNRKNPGEAFKISLGFPIGAHNLDRLQDYIAYSSFLGVDYIRFNRLLDLSKDDRFAGLILSQRGNAMFFEKMREFQKQNIADILSVASKAVLKHEGFARLNPDISIMVSTDFGFDGEETLELDEPINRCPGGTNLFAIFYELIYPCNELFDFPVGILTLKEKSAIESMLGVHIATDRNLIHSPEFDNEKIKMLESIVCDPRYKGCIGHTIRANRIKL
ncbi:MAG: hypothetical protein V1866_05435 [archaeon]